MRKVDYLDLNKEGQKAFSEATDTLYWVLNEHSKEEEISIEMPYNFFHDDEEVERCVSISVKIMNLSMDIRPALTIVEGE